MAVDPIIIALIDEFVALVSPLRRSIENEKRFIALLEGYGWSPQPQTVTQIQAAFAAAGDIAGIAQLAAVVAQDPEHVEFTTIEGLLTKLKGVIEGVQMLTQGTPALPAPFDPGSIFWTTFPLELVDELLFLRLRAKLPTVAALFQLVGIAEERLVDAAAPRGAFIRRRIVWENLPRLFSEPDVLLKETYSWDTGDPLKPFKHALALANLQRLIGTLSPVRIGFPHPALSELYYTKTNPALPAVRELRGTIFSGYTPGANTFYEFGAYILPIPASNTPNGVPVGLAIGPTFSGQAGIRVPVGPLALELSGGMDVEVGPRIEIRPSGVDVALDMPAPNIDAAVRILLDRGYPTILFGAAGSHRLQVKSVAVGIRALGPLTAPEFRFEFSLDELEFVLQFAGGDSFIQKLFGTDPQSIKVSMRIIWSSETGFAFEGGAALALTLTIHLDLGIILIETVTISISANTATGIEFGVGIMGKAAFGPLGASVDGIGIRATLQPIPAGDPPGSLGNLDLKFGLKPPVGIGLDVDAGPVGGGGYLFFDEKNEQYGGVANLQFKVLNLTAIGLLTTKMPDGTKGFSLLVIITAEFPPIQLGFGFTLNGVGGLLGINRTMVLEALRTGFKNKALDSIMFPPDPVRNAAKIVSDLRTFFPPAVGRFTFGPMVVLGWGSPAILRIEIGLVLELPSPVRLVIMGKIILALPTEDEAVVYLRLDVLGIIDFDRSEASIDASLIDSRIALFAVTGDMAMRASWGQTKTFALAAGGFHPRFEPPPSFPALARMAISLAMGDNPRLRLEAYFALTANTVQIGARFELYAGIDLGFVGRFSVSAYLGFDTLIQFDPFQFIAEMGAGISINRNDKPLIAATLVATLTGPAPWHGWGSATFEFLGKHEIPFDVTIGDPAAPATVAPVDVEAQLVKAFADAGNWSAELPDGSSMIVSLRKQDSGGRVLAHPFGRLTLRQRVVPLEKTIGQFGNAAVTGPDRFEITSATLGSQATNAPEAVYEDFAPAQFETLTDDQKLARPSFEEMIGGARFSVRALDAASDWVPASVDYEEVRIDVDPVTKVKLGSAPAAFTLDGSTFADLLHGGAAANAPSRQTGSAKFAGPKQTVRVRGERYVVATADGLGKAPAAVTGRAASGGSYAEAEEARQSWERENPGHEGELQVVADYEASIP